MPNILCVHRLMRASNWQDRPELQQVCEWWRKDSGVCALIGIGGAGKSAIADRFLRQIPDALPATDRIVKGGPLPTPGRVFVFSFYNNPNPSAFFEELAVWLSSDAFGESYRKPTRSQLLLLLRGPQSCLLVLDGLERIQDIGTRAAGFAESGDEGHLDTFGQIADGHLRDLLLNVAGGYLSNVKVLLTTRFRLFDPLADGSPFYFPIRVENLSEEASIELLRERGVTHGSDETLRDIARSQGCHALSVDLLGGYIAYFCKGDPSHLPPEPEIPSRVSSPSTEDHQLIRVCEQDRRFRRLAERYRESLSRADPAALSLLQRICLFRMGVESTTLERIFLGSSKVEISGEELAQLDPHQLDDKLDLLAAMKLIECTERESSTKFYTVHPAVRDGFLKSLDDEAALIGHGAVRQELEASLGGLPGQIASDPGTIDLLEEVIYHALLAGHPRDALDIYLTRLGGARNLGWRLGAFRQGERICRAFAGNRAPASASFPSELTTAQLTRLRYEWGWYLQNLGQTDLANDCYTSIIQGVEEGAGEYNAQCKEHLAYLALMTADLKLGFQAAEEALSAAECAEDASRIQNSYAYRAHAHALKGETESALADFRSSLHWQQVADCNRQNPLYSLRGLWYASLLCRLGQNDEARELTNRNKEILTEILGLENFQKPYCTLLLAELDYEEGKTDTASSLIDDAEEWAITHDSWESRCWSSLLRAKTALSRGKNQAATEAIREGLRIARSCGFGIFHIDLLLTRAKLHLTDGDEIRARRCLRVALYEGAERRPGSRLPRLPSARNSRCDYSWAIAEGLYLLAETELLQAAQKLGRSDLTMIPADGLSADVRAHIEQAKEHLDECRELRERIQDPRNRETQSLIDQVEQGILTYFPLEPGSTTESPHQEENEPPRDSADQSFDVFLSYSISDRPQVRELTARLNDRGLRVWFDETELVPGRPWQEALEEIIETAKSAAVLVGEAGPGPWQNIEMRSCLTEFVSRGLPVIPVLLPEASTTPSLPPFLKQFSWVDLREGLTENGLDRLQWGITGIKTASKSN